MSQEKIPPYTKDEIVNYVRDWKKNGIRLRVHPHLKIDRAYRNISTRDIEHVLTIGNLQWPPEWDKKHANFVYHIVGIDLDDSKLELIFKIDFENATIIIITGKPQ